MQEFGHSIRQHLPNAIIHVNEPSLELQVTLANGVEVSSGDGKSSGDKERDGKERVVMVVEAGKALFMECGRARQEIDDIIAQQQAHATRAQGR